MKKKGLQNISFNSTPSRTKAKKRRRDKSIERGGSGVKATKQVYQRKGGRAGPAKYTEEKNSQKDWLHETVGRSDTDTGRVQNKKKAT